MVSANSFIRLASTDTIGLDQTKVKHVNSLNRPDGRIFSL
jgi:hypothetical protein